MRNNCLTSSECAMSTKTGFDLVKGKDLDSVELKVNIFKELMIIWGPPHIKRLISLLGVKVNLEYKMMEQKRPNGSLGTLKGGKLMLSKKTLQNPVLGAGLV